MTSSADWKRYQQFLCHHPAACFSLDASRIGFSLEYLAAQKNILDAALDEMESLERGALANPDEKRQVGHYWLRDAALAPNTSIRSEIESTLLAIKTFAESVHSGRIAAPITSAFRHILLIGIGGSVLGPQFVNQALRSSRDPLDIYFFDNTDPDGMSQTLRDIPDLQKTLCLVISKSGGTKETRNGLIVAQHAWEEAGLDFARHAVAITCQGSALDKSAQEANWLARFPLWDWVGGRTSELSAVGLLPAALQGFDVDEMLRGARQMDQLSRGRDHLANPALLMALAWYFEGQGRGAKDMVVLPYKDRLELFSRYLQQLVMESLGKQKDRSGNDVYQGLAVYGNKGSTDQHAYIQQLRDGLNNFFAVFIEILEDEAQPGATEICQLEVEPGITCGDYLFGFYEGTRQALFENGRASLSITIQRLNAFAVGQLIALFERAVGFYASFININAYHQPGVEAGKRAAANVLELQKKAVAELQRSSATAAELAQRLGDPSQSETVYKILRRLHANQRIRVVSGTHASDTIFGI
ncbi:MAG: glucose-6-phosphate isomerase [Bdellovibrionales bacterium]|nr:glucose-6-phosphate isomerase [Bdellovibrionales bacterium]